MIQALKPIIFVVIVGSAIALLLWLDQTISGPVSKLEKCSFHLSRGQAEPADLLIIGSSRVGVSLDPVAISDMLSAVVPGREVRVERIALPISPLRPSVFLLERYIATRGAPKAVVFEVSFMSRRSVDNLEQNLGKPNAEEYVFGRDINFMTFWQILAMPSVAMPFSSDEHKLTLLSLKLKGLLMRSGALIYEFTKSILQPRGAHCGVDDWRVGGMAWPAGFEFSFAHSRHHAPPKVVAGEYLLKLKELEANRVLQKWQLVDDGLVAYPYDFMSEYRRGELSYLDRVVRSSRKNGFSLVVLPMTLYGSRMADQDIEYISSIDRVNFIDLYAQAGSDIDKFWYNSAHVTPDPAGVYISSILAGFIVDNNLL